MPRVSVGPHLVEVVKLAYEANRPVMLVGQTGVGKSESLAAAARTLGVEHVVLDLSLMEAPDLTGLPVVIEGRTTYAPPAFLPSSGKGLLVFEELNRAPRYVQAPCLQLLTTRRLNGGYELPQSWLPAAAVNPDDGEYLVDAMDPALLARFMVVDVEPDVRCWVAWAATNSVHPAVVDFVRNTPDIFAARESNPRAWTYVSEVVHAHESMGASGRSLAVGVAGLVGETLARAFLKTYRGCGGMRVPSAASLIASYSKHRTTIRALAASGDTAMLNAIVRQILLHLQEPSNEAATRDDVKAVGDLAQLVADLPAEFRRKVRSECKWIPSPAARPKGGRARPKRKATKRKGKKV